MGLGSGRASGLGLRGPSPGIGVTTRRSEGGRSPPGAGYDRAPPRRLLCASTGLIYSATTAARRAPARGRPRAPSLTVRGHSRRCRGGSRPRSDRTCLCSRPSLVSATETGKLRQRVHRGFHAMAHAAGTGRAGRRAVETVQGRRSQAPAARRPAGHARGPLEPVRPGPEPGAEQTQELVVTANLSGTKEAARSDMFLCGVYLRCTYDSHVHTHAFFSHRF